MILCPMPRTILVADDDPNIRQLLVFALGKAGLDTIEAADGEAALTEVAAHHPDLVVLDINMPRKNGLEVLEEIKGDPELRPIPVLILTTSQAEDDVRRSYSGHASGYVVKPVGFENFLQAIRAFEDFWLTFVRFPPRS